MSDVLSTAEMRDLDQAFAQEYGTTGTRDVYSMWHRVMRSHEQLRGERDAALARKDELVVSGVAAVEEWTRCAREYEAKIVAAEAAVRAGGCAADLCRWLVSMDDPEDVLEREERRTVTLTKITDRARDALAAFDRAVSGQTAEKEEA